MYAKGCDDSRPAPVTGPDGRGPPRNRSGHDLEAGAAVEGGCHLDCSLKMGDGSRRTSQSWRTDNDASDEPSVCSGNVVTDGVQDLVVADEQ